MKPRPTFRIVVTPIAYVHSCKAKQAEEAAGLMGFHDFPRCPDCQVEPAGFEFWGENGHLQGSAPSVERASWRIHHRPSRDSFREVFEPARGILYYRGRAL